MNKESLTTTFSSSFIGLFFVGFIPLATCSGEHNVARPEILNMRSDQNVSLAKQFLETLGAGAPASAVAELFTPDLEWNVPGHTGVLPWIGKKTGRGAIVEFVRDTQTMIQREQLDIYDILANDERAVILGHLQTRVTSTGKLIDSAFAIVLKFSGNLISHFLMLEDSYATSLAAKGD